MCDLRFTPVSQRIHEDDLKWLAQARNPMQIKPEISIEIQKLASLLGAY